MGNVIKKLDFKRMGAATPTRRTVVPNHLFPENGPPKDHPNHKYVSNKIKTNKYSILSFVPINLFEQFHRFANLYFVFIVLLNWVPAVNAFGKEVAMLPLLFVLSVTAIKDGFEDYRRYKSDKKINNLSCRVYSRYVFWLMCFQIVFFFRILDFLLFLCYVLGFYVESCHKIPQLDLCALGFIGSKIPHLTTTSLLFYCV